ncbi:MAG: gliding motility-associated C-terminal domain-containing protein, partial [Bacteroidia bacterium]
GLDSLGKFVGNNVRGYLLEPTYNFDQLKKGTYTIIAFRAKSTPCKHPEFYQTNYILKATTIEDEKKDGGNSKCTPLYQFAKTAGQVNDGNALTCNEPNTSSDKTSYKVPATCLNETNNRGNVHWYNKKKYPGLRAQYAYLEFELKDKSDVFFHTNTHFQVLKGFISKDSSIAKDAKHVAIEHAYGQYRDCTFKAGKYTLVIHGTATYWFNIDVGHSRKNEADHAANAKTLGLISSNNPKVSRSAAFNCNSTFSETDYIKDANTWFTFRVAGRGKVYLSGIDEDSYQYSIIAQGSRNHHLSFDELKKLGSIDSIAGVNQNLLYANREGKQKYIYKNTTDTIRYYVLAESRVPSGIFNLQVEFEFDSLATPIGDYCYNAVEGSMSGTGSLQLGQWASIHTIGEGANEQFKNQLKEARYNISDLKSTWFSVDFKNVQGSKLFVSGNNSNAYEIKVYRGDCSAMTLVGALLSWQNISLDCIQDGTYMFQLYSNAYVHDSVVLNIQVLPANGICPMVDPQKVIANFELTNGCAGDTIQFINLSSAGTAIEYEWKFGNNDISTQVNPSRIFKGSDDSQLVSLVVRNKTTLESDTAYEWIYLNKPVLELINDTTVCGTDVSLEIENFDASKYIYGWHSADRYITIDGVEQLRTYAKGRRYTYSLWADTVNQIIVSARNKNCKTLDTIKVYSLPMILAQKEQENFSVLCYKQLDTIQIKKPDYPKVDAFWNDGETQLSRIVTDTGTYNFTLKTAHCKYDGAIAVIGTKGPIYHLDSVFCQGDNISDHLNIIHPGDYQLIKINDTTKWLAWLQDSLITFNWSAQVGMCRFYDTLKAPISGYWSREGFDSTICEGDTIELKVFTNSYKLVWSNGHEGRKLKVYSPGTVVLNASAANCSYSNEYNISMIERALPIKDTTVCNFDPPLHYKVNDMFSVLWNTGESSNSIMVNDSGHYWFVAKTENCEFLDTFQVTRDCPPQLYIPNAFTPGADNLNPTFIAKGTEIENYEMRIYAQNGQRVFYTKNLSEGWDGTVRFEPAPLGTYYYVITYTLKGESRVESGNLSLIK